MSALPMPSSKHEPTSILVTGGAGFIGSNFLLRMVRQWPDVRFVNLDALTYAGNLMNLRAIENAENYAFVQGDITDVDLLRGLFSDHGFSTVVHFAAESHVDRSIQDPTAFIRTNVDGTAALLDAARRHWTNGHGRFVHVSTDEVFGSLGDDGYFTETTPYDPRSPYSASKAASDHLVRAYGHTYGLPFVITNCSNNYGPFQFPEKLIPLVIANARNERPVPIYGAGENVRDWLYVEDHCTALETILLNGEDGETYVIGGDAERRNIDLVEQILDLVDERLGREVGQSRQLIEFVKDRAGHDFRYAMDFSKLRRELGWEPSVDLETGLRKTVDWYLDNPEWLEAVMNESYRDYYEAQYHHR
jgi:dTDP-glucose 4,6-dehydratase